MKNDKQESNRKQTRINAGTGVAIGIALGTGIGIALGAGIGASLDRAIKKKDA